MSRRHRPTLLAVALLALLAPLVATSVGSSATAQLHRAGLTAPSWKQVSAGENHTCAVATTGYLFCWGRNDYGQLGVGDQDPRSFPVEVVGGWNDWTSVSAGGDTTCALRASRRLYCWGSNSWGGVGDGGDEGMRTAPSQVWGNRTDWTQVSTGWGHACARRASGRLFCWGYNSDGQLGDGTDTRRLRPVQVTGKRTDWRLVDVGNGSTCARRTSGRLFCWGYNDEGQLGDGTRLRRLKPVQVAGRRTDWAAVDIANHHTCATRTTGRLFCWGDGTGGQLGTGALEDQFKLTPVQVSGRRTDWRSVSLGYNHTCARRSSSELYCWGVNSFGQLGDDTDAPRLLPTLVAGGFTDWSAVDVGSDHSCGRRASGQVHCWGYDGYGQLGTTGDNQSSPTEVTLG